MTTKPKFIQVMDDLTLSTEMNLDDLYYLDTIAERVFGILELDPDSELAIVIATDGFVRQLNSQHRGIDKTTDVLSFPSDPLPPEIAAEETPYLGDLIAAYHYTLQQASHHDHRPQDEFALLVVHGILHLIGYDHNTQSDQTKMWEQQAAILEQLDINIIVPNFLHSEND